MRLGASHYLLLTTVLYLCFALFSINKPLTLDQALPTAWNAGAIAHFGWAALGSTKNYYEISHTLLHQHLLAINYLVLGETTLAARLLGVMCFIGTLFLILRLSAILFPGKTGITIGGLAAGLYALNPFAVQYSLLVDQETTILPLLLLIFFYYLVRANFDFTPIAVAKLSALFALCIWGKELTPYFALIALFPFLWLYRGFRHACLITAQIGLFGTAIFAATWILYSSLTGIAVLSFIDFSIIRKALNPSFHEGRSMIGMLGGLFRTGRWLGPALLVLFASSALYRILQVRKKRFELRPVDYLWLYTLVFWAITNLHMYTYSRYQYPLYSVAVILIGEYLYTALEEINRRQVVVSIATSLIGAVLLVCFLSDPLLLPVTHYILFVVIAPLLFCFTLVVIATKSPLLSHHTFILSMLSFLIATNLTTNIKQTDSYTTAVSWGEYGEKGFMETVSYLKANLAGSVPILRKDIGYYLTIGESERKFKWIYNNIFRGDLKDPAKLDRIEKTILRYDVRYIVLDQYANGAEARALIGPYFDFIHQFGDFEIYRKSSGTDHLSHEKRLKVSASIPSAKTTSVIRSDPTS